MVMKRKPGGRALALLLLPCRRALHLPNVCTIKQIVGANWGSEAFLLFLFDFLVFCFLF